MHYNHNQLVFKLYWIVQFRISSSCGCVRILLKFCQKRKDVYHYHFYQNKIFAIQFYFKYIELSIISISCESLSEFYRSNFCQIIFEYFVFCYINQNIHKTKKTQTTIELMQYVVFIEQQRFIDNLWQLFVAVVKLKRILWWFINIITMISIFPFNINQLFWLLWL